jgi:hypothetical protein
MSATSRPEDRRSESRHVLDEPAVCVVLRSVRSAPGTRIPGRLVALSAGGFSFVAGAPLAAGDVVRLLLRTPSAAGVEPDAIVLRRESATAPVVGARFTELQPGLACRLAARAGLLDAA